MSRGVNKVIIIGNLGLDPEVKHMPNGGIIVSINIATTNSWKNKNTNKIESKTEWHRVILYNKLGEIASVYLKKGSKVFIEGSLRTNKWKDQNGNDRYVVDIIANNIEILDKKVMDNVENEGISKSIDKKKVNNDVFDEDVPF